MKDTQKREEATTMKVSDKARGLHDYLAEYRDVPADIAEAEFTEEALQFMEAAVEAEKQQRAERERCDQEFEAQAEANLKIIFDIPGEIGKRIDFLLEKAQIEKTTLARQIGVGRTTIHRYISGTTVPNRKKLLLIVDALSLSLGDFCYEPRSFDNWKNALEKNLRPENDVFIFRDNILNMIAKNNFTYQNNEKILRLPHKYYVVIKTMLEGSLRVLDLLSHDIEKE